MAGCAVKTSGPRSPRSNELDPQRHAPFGPRIGVWSELQLHDGIRVDDAATNISRVSSSLCHSCKIISIVKLVLSERYFITIMYGKKLCCLLLSSSSQVGQTSARASLSTRRSPHSTRLGHADVEIFAVEIVIAFPRKKLGGDIASVSTDRRARIHSSGFENPEQSLVTLWRIRSCLPATFALEKKEFKG